MAPAYPTIAIDPDSEIITSSTVTPGNAADGSVAKELLKEALETEAPKQQPTEEAILAASSEETAPLAREPVEVYGDSSYGTGEVLEHLESAGAAAHVKVQAPASPDGQFTKDAFHIDLASDTVTCPAGQLVQIRRRKDGSGVASFGAHCAKCPLAASCTKSKEGRNVTVNPREHLLQHARTEQKSPAWRAGYKATRPKVERKLAHLMRRRHGGRRARVRGAERVTRDFTMLCAAENLRRLAALGLRHDEGSRTRWAV